MQQRGQHFGRHVVMLPVMAETGQQARLIMIVQVNTVPGFPLQLGLPFAYDLFKAGQLPRRNLPLAGRPRIDAHQLELEHHIQLFSVASGKQNCVLRRHVDRLPDRHDIVFGQHFPVHLLQKLMHARSVDVMLPASRSVRAVR
ncbi:hypothetical protein D3C73_1396440 [compost metagenome]